MAGVCIARVCIIWIYINLNFCEFVNSFNLYSVSTLQVHFSEFLLSCSFVTLLTNVLNYSIFSFRDENVLRKRLWKYLHSVKGSIVILWYSMWFFNFWNVMNSMVLITEDSLRCSGIMYPALLPGAVTHQNLKTPFFVIKSNTSKIDLL